MLAFVPLACNSCCRGVRNGRVRVRSSETLLFRRLLLRRIVLLVRSCSLLPVLIACIDYIMYV